MTFSTATNPSRRQFLRGVALAGTALALCTAVPARAQDAPVQPIEAWLGRSIKTTAGVAGNDPRLLAYYSAASGKLNGLAGGTGASWLRTFGKLAKGSARLAGKLVFGRVGTAIMVAGVVFNVGATLWGWYEQEQAERSAIEACPVGGSCRIPNGNGGNDWYTHTRETATSASNFSLQGARGGNNWSLFKQVAAPNRPPPAVQTYTYDAWWKYIGSGTYDPNYAIPDQGATATTGGLSPQAVEELLRERGEQTALDPVMMANIVNALNDLVRADTTVSADVRAIAEMIAANPATPGTSTHDASNVARVGDLIGVTSPSRPITITDTSTQTGTTPSPSPSPSASPSPSPSPTSGAFPPLGTPVDPVLDLNLPGWDEIAAALGGAFAPVLGKFDLGGTCPTINWTWFGETWGTFRAFPVTGHCDLFDGVPGPAAAVSAAAGGIRAIFIVGDA